VDSSLKDQATALLAADENRYLAVVDPATSSSSPR
jgi:hypothetical protein